MRRQGRCCREVKKLIRELVDSLDSDEEGWVHRGRDIKGTLQLEFVQDGDAGQVAFSVKVIPGTGACWLPRRCETVELQVEGSRVPLSCCTRRKLLKAARRWIVRYANQVALRVLA